MPPLNYPGRSGQIAVHRTGEAAVLARRKTGADAVPHPGWWVVGGGGLADYVLESDDWVLVDGPTVFRLLTEDPEATA